MTKRYIIEVTDEYGPVDYNAHDCPAAAIAEAETLQDGFPKTVVIDRQEQVAIWSNKL